LSLATQNAVAEQNTLVMFSFRILFITARKLMKQSYNTECRLSPSSSTVCGAGGIPLDALQPTEAYCANTAILFSRSLPEALHVRRRERPLPSKGGNMGEKWPVKFS
jgi:hypothetical protein